MFEIYKIRGTCVLEIFTLESTHWKLLTFQETTKLNVETYVVAFDDYVLKAKSMIFHNNV